MPANADMENLTPPKPVYTERSPKPALLEPGPLIDGDSLEAMRVGSIEKAASLYVDGCEGDDRYDNNCAHFLSNAFLLAGANDLSSDHDCVEARCGTIKKRPIRARDMKCWFASKAKETSRTIVENKGYWAVFQLKESEYWGGHVAIIVSDRWKFYGTGWYDDWDQFWYKW